MKSKLKSISSFLTSWIFYKINFTFRNTFIKDEYVSTEKCFIQKPQKLRSLSFHIIFYYFNIKVQEVVNGIRFSAILGAFSLGAYALYSGFRNSKNNKNAIKNESQRKVAIENNET